MKRTKHEEERVANRIAKTIADVTLDLDLIGFYIALQPNVVYRRLEEIVESAEEQRENLSEKLYP